MDEATNLFEIKEKNPEPLPPNEIELKEFEIIETSEIKKRQKEKPHQFFLKKEFQDSSEKEENPSPEKFEFETIKEKNFPKQNGAKEKFHWKPAIVESLYFLGIQHGFRLVQKKTRDQFRGEFFNDWGESIRSLEGWKDGDNTFTNYVAHPMQGGVTGRIFINNSDKSKKLEFSKSKEYWKSRFKAMIWSAVWSTQFEMGPISEATIGNVGIRRVNGYSTMAWVDLVMTPTAGTGVLIGEDIVDKYILKKWLEKGSSPTKIRILRTFLTPIQSFTNVLGGKFPWKRHNR